MKNLARKRSVIFLSITLAFLVALIIALIIVANALAGNNEGEDFILFGFDDYFVILLISFLPIIILGTNSIYAVKDIIYRKDNILFALALTRGILSFGFVGVGVMYTSAFLCALFGLYYIGTDSFYQSMAVTYFYVAPAIVTLLWIIYGLIKLVRRIKKKRKDKAETAE